MRKIDNLRMIRLQLFFCLRPTRIAFPIISNENGIKMYAFPQLDFIKRGNNEALIHSLQI